MNTSGNGIARTHETDALDLSTMTKHEMPYGIDAIAEIRMSTPADYPAIIRMGEAADMGTLDGFEDTLVATHLSGGIAAFCRLRIYDGIAHVNPIVVDESLRGHGVGAALMKAASSLAAMQWGSTSSSDAPPSNGTKSPPKSHPIAMIAKSGTNASRSR